MSDRRCGYCREPGHTSDKCNIRKSQIDFIRRHVWRTRKYIADTLVSQGIGIGAIITTTDYWSGEEFPSVLPSFEFIKYINVVDYNKIKYSKTVKATLFSYGVHEEVPENLSKYIRIVKKSYVDAATYKMDDMGRTCMACVPTTNDFKVAPYEYRRQTKVLSPSYDPDPDTSYLTERFRLNERLTLNKGGSILTSPLMP